MRIILSHHAKKRAVERGVLFENIQEAIEFPEYVISKNEKIEAYRKFGSKTLKVVYSKKDNYIKVVTLIWK